VVEGEDLEVTPSHGGRRWSFEEQEHLRKGRRRSQAHRRCLSDIWARGTLTDHVSGPSSGGRPKTKPTRIKCNHQLEDHDV
jgi:hypothetical protein